MPQPLFYMGYSFIYDKADFRTKNVLALVQACIQEEVVTLQVERSEGGIMGR